MVLGLATAAVEVLVQRARRAGGEVGDDEAGIGPLRAGLDAGDDALDPAPAGRVVVDFLVTPQLVGPTVAACRAAVLRSSVSTWRRSVVVVATPRMKSMRSARQKSSTSGAQ